MRTTALLTTLVIVSSIFGGSTPEDIGAAVDEALIAIKMRESDLSVLSLMFDPFRLSIVDSCMDRPLEMPAFLDSVGMRFTNPDADLVQLFGEASGIMDLHPERPVMKSADEEYAWKDKKEIPVRLREALDIIFAAFEGAAVDFEAAFSEIDSFQMDTIETFGTSHLLRDGESDIDSKAGESTLEELDDAELEDEKRVERLFNITAEVDRERLAAAAMTILNAALAAEDKVDGLTAKTNGGIDVPDSIASGDVIYWCETKRGPVAIGGPGRTIYSGRFAAVIDLGGDDIYLGAAGGADTNVPFAVCIDLGGDDTYSSREQFAFGSGGVGVGILIDSKGDDLYRSGDFGIGSGCYGTGILIDREGDDIYSGDIASQGAAFMGFGFLFDREGNDSYSARLFSQGFGYVGGFGMIADFDGNDSYIVQGAYVDRLRYADHHLSLSQGFGYGNRPDWSGGIGLLLDRAGNDIYIADIFGQGSSYWFALGGLWDGAGNDAYSAYQYSQGAATHLCAGILLDKSGGDNYVAHGVSQGCGHDLSVGYLLDLEGDDNYVVSDLSQGAGNANGVGIFIDVAGDDGYVNKKEYNVQGYGSWRRDFGSTGIMLDLGGSDKYSGKGDDSSWWSSGKYGIGIDFPAKMPEESQ